MDVNIRGYRGQKVEKQGSVYGVDERTCLTILRNSRRPNVKLALSESIWETLGGLVHSAFPSPLPSHRFH